MKPWDALIREDHHALESQAGALEAALSIDLSTQDRRVVFSWILRGLSPSLELHLRKEEAVFFPALQRLLGESAGALVLLQQEHQELRRVLRHLAELLQDWERIDWQMVTLASEAFLHLLEEHEKKEDRLLVDVLEHSLKPKQLKGLAQQFQEVAQKAYAEEGWPSSPYRGRPSE